VILFTATVLSLPGGGSLAAQPFTVAGSGAYHEKFPYGAASLRDRHPNATVKHYRRC
jgi:hypothetical protein